jgi:hypothetical protein
MPTACFEFGILELWANNGVFDEKSDADIENLTKEQILQKINSHNTRCDDLPIFNDMFLKM